MAFGQTEILDGDSLKNALGGVCRGTTFAFRVDKMCTPVFSTPANSSDRPGISEPEKYVEGGAVPHSRLRVSGTTNRRGTTPGNDVPSGRHTNSRVPWGCLCVLRPATR